MHRNDHPSFADNAVVVPQIRHCQLDHRRSMVMMSLLRLMCFSGNRYGCGREHSFKTWSTSSIRKFPETPARVGEFETSGMRQARQLECRHLREDRCRSEHDRSGSHPWFFPELRPVRRRSSSEDRRRSSRVHSRSDRVPLRIDFLHLAHHLP